MKSPMWFVKAVGVDSTGAVKAQILLTPPMSLEQAQQYNAFVVSAIHADKLRYMLDSYITEHSTGVESVEYVVFETTLY